MRVLQHISHSWWAKIAVGNLLIVGVLGLLMRLKIVLPISWLNQQHLLHAHSHFAFGGWVTHALMVLVILVLSLQRGRMSPAERGLVLANLIAAYGMLVSFFLQGYGLYSIAVSTIGVLVSYWFAIYVWRKAATSKADLLARNWFRTAVVFLAISSLGVFVLSYLMANNNMDPRKQLAAVYFYLHFQYNGWFLFACMGLLQQWLSRHGMMLRHSRSLFLVFAVACIPTYFLSILWWNMPIWLYWVLVAAALMQLGVWIFWFREILSRRRDMRLFTSRLIRFLLLVVGIAFSVKLLLQALSLIPELSQFAYGFRPIVIGYLHLVLLAVISLFILAYLISNGYLRENRWVRAAVLVTVVGIFLNELLLGLQGLSGMLRIYIGSIPQVLALASGIICAGVLGVLLGQLKQDDKHTIH